eukprot:TRINITY_DN2782_c1_g1_i2.p1 TRINITY_DN2782_c1_g1~~TRINITY_DN2782_c1_g1_i2.p1  ORF type:complete len:295 (-),score=65.12 TRINITY_DN2782_c1_g1_i2:1067-1951(-)
MQATTQDLNEISTLLNTSETPYLFPHQTLTELFNKKLLRAIITRNKESQLTGVLLYHVAFSFKGKIYFIENIHVHPEYRREGIGRQLFDALREKSQSEGMRLMRVEVEEENQAGVGFWKEMGADLDPEWWTCFIGLENRDDFLPVVVPGFTSRLATEEDAQVIRDLVVEVAVYENLPNAVTAQVCDYEDAVRNGELSAVFIVDDVGSVVGMALFHDCFVKEGRALYLEDFVVVEAHRRKGLGRMLFDHLIQEGVSRASKRLYWRVIEWNVNAIGFYDKYGAQYIKGRYNGQIFN